MDHFKTSSSAITDCSSQSSGNEEDMRDLRRGPWTVEEDFTLINYIALHGEGRWNSLARSAGLKRTGKSCRLRWLNYLRPDVRRGNITLEEQLLILELHSRWGNRWSKIAQHLPGRTDNEIKNYWRTRVQKHAKQLKCDVNSKQFKDTMRYLWMPRLVERIQAAASAASTTAIPQSATSSCLSADYHPGLHNHQAMDTGLTDQLVYSSQSNMSNGFIQINQTSFVPENSSTAVSTGSFRTAQVVSPISDLTDGYNYPDIINQSNNNQDCYQVNQLFTYGDSLISHNSYFNQGFDYQTMDQTNPWMETPDVSDCLWNMEDVWFLPQEPNTNML